MFSTALGAAAGLASYFGQRDANDANRGIANATNAFSAREAEKNRNFQERMSSSSWQRGKADMIAAGINPMLLVSQGGASTPGGSAIGGTTGHAQQDAIGKAAGTALQASLLKSQLDNVQADTDVKKATAANVSAQIPGTSASSQFEAAKYGALNDLVGIAKHVTNYDANVSSAKSAKPGFISRGMSRIQDYTRNYRSK